MRTIYLVSRTRVSGPINQGLNILNGMKQNGRVNSTLVTISPEIAEKSWLYRYKELGIDIKQFNLPMWKILSAILQLKRYVKDNGIEVIHSCGYRANFVALMAHTGAKIVITQRCHPDEIAEKFPKLIQPIFSKFYMMIIKRMNAIVACSKSIQSIFRNEFGMNVECVQNGVNSEYFRPTTEVQKKSLREELGLPLNSRIYLVLGSLRDRKNNALILDALEKLNQSEFTFVFVGNGPEKDMLKDKAKKIKNVIFAGSTKTPIKFLQAADILVSASLAEGLPNSVLEAMSCGLPCILSDIDPHKELVEGSSVGSIFDRFSVDDLCEKIMDSYQWNIKTKSLEARKVVEENFAVKSLAEKYERIYEKVLSM